MNIEQFVRSPMFDISLMVFSSDTNAMSYVANGMLLSDNLKKAQKQILNSDSLDVWFYVPRDTTAPHASDFISLNVTAKAGDYNHWVPKAYEYHYDQPLDEEGAHVATETKDPKFTLEAIEKLKNYFEYANNTFAAHHKTH
jgi:hypothetical protein